MFQRNVLPRRFLSLRLGIDAKPNFLSASWRHDPGRHDSGIWSIGACRGGADSFPEDGAFTNVSARIANRLDAPNFECEIARWLAVANSAGAHVIPFSLMSSPLSFAKILSIVAVFCALSLGGCALDSRDRSFLLAHGVGGSLYQKMLHGEPLEIPDIIELSHHGLPPRFIIHYLEDTYFVYNLKTSDVMGLKKAGVSPEVIDYLLATPGLYGPYR